MNLIEALRTGLPLRRPVAKHLGSSGNGWISSHLVFYQFTGPWNGIYWESRPSWALTEDDILANDWEVKKEYEVIGYKLEGGVFDPKLGTFKMETIVEYRKSDEEDK